MIFYQNIEKKDNKIKINFKKVFYIHKILKKNKIISSN